LQSIAEQVSVIRKWPHPLKQKEKYLQMMTIKCEQGDIPMPSSSQTNNLSSFNINGMNLFSTRTAYFQLTA
jgi:hypothetical protein